MSSLDLATQYGNLATQYGNAEELRQAALEARTMWKALGVELRAADDTAREANPLHNRFRPRSRNGRTVVANMRKAMPEHARTAAATADRLREQRRCLNKTADILANSGHLDPLVCGPGLAGVDLAPAPTLRRVLDRWKDARAAADEHVPTDPISGRRAALLAQLEQIHARAARMLKARE